MKLKISSYRLITAIYVTVICLFSLLPGIHKHGHGSNMGIQIFWNFLHIPVYGILAYLILRSFSSITMKIYVLSFIIAVLFGVFNEFLQAFVPFRTVSLMDIMLNGIGAAMVLVPAYLLSSERLKWRS